MYGDERNKLIEDNIGLVHFVLDRYFGYLNDDYLRRLNIEYEDLLQEGSLGLIDAADGDYDPDLGEFSTYATQCIRNRITNFICEQNRTGGDTVSLNTKIGNGDDGRPIPLGDTIASLENVEENVARSEISQKVREVLDNEKILTPRERKIVKLRFYEDYTFQEIGQAVGLTKEGARVVFCKSLGKLKPYLEDLNNED